MAEEKGNLERTGNRSDLVSLTRKLGNAVKSEPKNVAIIEGLGESEAHFLMSPEMQERFNYAPAGKYGGGIKEDDDGTYSVHAVSPGINYIGGSD